MEAILFIGIQASGKTSFYKEKFLKTHLRISLDLLKTRNKEQQFLQLCFHTGQKFVVDNTNPTLAERSKYIAAAKAVKFKIIGYYFKADINEAIRRNGARHGKEAIAVIGLRATNKKLQPPTMQEGFDELFEVQLIDRGFEVRPLIQNY